MKGLRKSPLFLLVLTSTIGLSVFAWREKNGVYAGYTYDWKKEPVLTVVMQGIQDGNSPIDLLPDWLQQNIEEEVPASVIKGGDEVTTLSGNLIVVTVSANDIGNEDAGNENTNRFSESVSDNKAKKVYQFQKVEESYFDDALFIGDSRTVGLSEYSGLTNATFYAKTSLTIYDFYDKKFIPVEGEKEKITLDEALQLKQYGKIYVMFGINEMGRGTPQNFGAEYLKVLTRIRELQPDAILFVEGIMHVTAAKSESDPIYNNNNISMRNALLATVDNHHDVFYIDMNEAVCDGHGDLKAEYTFDDIHLKASYYSLWREFLLQHGIVR